MANSLPFKCYLLTNNGQDKEIRRFALDSDVVGNFTYLQEKVRVVYPQLLRESFTISYIGKIFFTFCNFVTSKLNDSLQINYFYSFR
jgi:hypothetical protein